MDLAASQVALAAALSTVDDVTGHAYRPATKQLQAGDGWARLGPMERGPGRVFEVAWRVFVALPRGGPESTEWVQAHVEDIVDALEPVGFVDQIEVVEIPDGDSSRYALQFIVRSE